MAFSIIVVSLGTADLAAQQIAFNIASLSVLPAFAFSIAAATMVGQSLGANQPEDARRSAILTTELGMMWMLSMGIVFALFRSQFVALYTSEAEVIRLGSGLMLFIACGQAFQAVSIVLSGALRGAGDTRYTLLMMVVGVWVGRVGVGWLMGIVLGLGLYGVWLGWAVDFVSRAILIVLRFRSGRWQKSF